MFKKIVLAAVLTLAAFSANAASVSVVNKLVSIQFANGVTFTKDYSPFCSTGIGTQTTSTSQNGVTVESVKVYCVTVVTSQAPPFFTIQRRLLETIRDR